MLAHTVRWPKNRSPLRLREPRRLPEALSQFNAAQSNAAQSNAAKLLASFRTWRNRAIADRNIHRPRKIIKLTS